LDKSQSGALKSGEKSEYDLALISLKDGKFEDAERQFADFISKYPSVASLASYKAMQLFGCFASRNFLSSRNV